MLADGIKMKFLINLLILTSAVIVTSPRCQAQRVIADTGSGEFVWEEVYGDQILRFNASTGKWSSVPSPVFLPTRGPEYTSFLWDGASLFKFMPSLDNEAGQISMAQIGTLASGPSRTRTVRAAEWIWSAPVELPGKTLPLAVCQSRMLVEIPVRKGEGSRLERNRILAEVDFKSGKVTNLESIKLTAGQFFLALGVQYGNEGLVFCNTGHAYRWNAKGGIKRFPGSFLEPVKGDICAPIDDGMTPYPSFFASPFLGENGDLIIGIQYLTKSRSKDPSPRQDQPRSDFLAFDPRTGKGGRIDPITWEHLFHPDSQGLYSKLKEEAGSRFGIDASGRIQPLNMDRILSELSSQPLPAPRKSPGNLGTRSLEFRK
jgi:hypothetical protein